MDLTSSNLQAISKIYDVTLDTNQWSDVLDELDLQVGSVGCNVFATDHTNTELTSLHVSQKLIPALEYYLEHEYQKLDEAFLPNLHEMIPDQKFVSIHDLYIEPESVTPSSRNYPQSRINTSIIQYNNTHQKITRQVNSETL